jgi:hypothetical protein
MADNIKTIRILKKDLPEFSGSHGTYSVRFKIASVDQNRDSHWSPFYFVNINPQVAIDHTQAIVNSANKTVSCVWTVDNTQGSTFDIYIRWIGASATGQSQIERYPWKYVNTISNTSYLGIIPTSITAYNKNGTTSSVTPTSVQIAVQTPTYPKERFTSATLFETTAAAL